MKTRFTELVGIQYPIMCGGMFQVGRAELAIAVSEAGGLGTITSATQGTPENLRKEIRKIKEGTNKPFAVNLSLFPSQNPIPNEEFIQVMVEENVRIVETSGRSPKELMNLLKKHDFTVIHKVVGVKHAKSAEQLGVDVISVVGNETGGHPGMNDVGTLVALPRVVDSVQIPVIAGGGIADGRGLVSAMALGAEGVLMGTRFMATKEATIHENVKNWMVAADENKTIIVQKNIGSPSRVAVNAVSKQVERMEKDGAGIEELLPLITGKRAKHVYSEGDMDGGLMSCGQSVGLIYEVPFVKDLIDKMMDDANSIIGNLQEVGHTTV